MKNKSIARTLSLLLIFTFVFSALTACGASSNDKHSKDTGSVTDAETTGVSDTDASSTTGASDGHDSDTTNDTTASPPDDTTSDTAAADTTDRPPETTEKAPVTTKPEEDNKEPEDPHMLDGKKVIIIGNSYVYNGNCVMTKSTSIASQSARNNDNGYFYQLCKANGANVSVTNWTFGGHSLGNLFDGGCNYSSCPFNGKNHEDYLINRKYDYVIVSPGGGTADQTIAADFDYITNFFKAANPDVKIICLGNLGAHGYSSSGKDLPGVYNYYKTLEDKGVVIADWGTLVWRIMKGHLTVPGATESYSLNTFIVKDGYHPNALAGYITALVAYCAITGEDAQGQPYSFCFDTSISSSFNMSSYISKNYIGANTNFTKIFASKSDMSGLQKLVDDCLAQKPWRKVIDKNDVSTDTVQLTNNPDSDLISVIFSDKAQSGNGWRKTSSKWALAGTAGYEYFSGLRGDADAVCSLEGTATANGLSASQKADLADIRYGISIIGLSHMEKTAFEIESTTENNNVTATSLYNIINGHFGSSWQSLLYFDSAKYNVNGEASSNGEYTALITLNFGQKKTFDAIGYAAGNLKNVPQAQDIYVSDDGINWTKVKSACYDTSEITLYNIEDRAPAKDPWANNTPSYEVLFDMNGAKGKYIRIAIKDGARADYNGLQAREIIVFGE